MVRRYLSTLLFCLKSWRGLHSLPLRPLRRRKKCITASRGLLGQFRTSGRLPCRFGEKQREYACQKEFYDFRPKIKVLKKHDTHLRTYQSPLLVHLNFHVRFDLSWEKQFQWTYLCRNKVIKMFYRVLEASAKNGIQLSISLFFPSFHPLLSKAQYDT